MTGTHQWSVAAELPPLVAPRLHATTNAVSRGSRGEEAADGLNRIQQAIDGVIAPPPTQSVDELMKKVEEGTPPASRDR